MNLNDSATCVPVDFDPFAGGELTMTFAATEAQREVWTASQLGADASRAFNESVSVTLVGSVDESALERAVQELYNRHESLRSVFSSNGEHVWVLASSHLAVRRFDFTGLSDVELDKRLGELTCEEVEHSFDLENGPLLRATLVRQSERSVVLILTAHHIVCDGWSMFLLLKELGPLYVAARSGRPAALPEAQPFSAYARHVEQLDDTAVCEFWRKQYEQSIPVIDLPSDNPRPPRRSFNSAREDYFINYENVTTLKQFAIRQKSSFFTLLFTGWTTYIHRLTGETSLVTGVPTAGQSSSEMPGVIGHCVNLLPVRVELTPETPFSALLQKLKGVLLDAFDHQEYTFGRLLRQLRLQRDPSRVPLVPFQFNLDPGTDPKTYGFEGLDVELKINARTYENFELFLNLVDTGKGLEVQCQYNTALYEGPTIRGWLEGIERLLLSACLAPDEPISRLELLSEAEKELVLRTWNETSVDVPFSSPSLAIAQQSRLTPEAIAAECEGQIATYGQLEAQVNRLANHLCERGVEPNSLVGLCVERSLDMLVACLAIWKTGAAYVPLDPSFPSDRLEYMVQDADIRVLVTQQSLESRVSAPSARKVLLDVERDEIGQRPTSDPARSIAPDSPAYVIYTSGSTGKPKGVQVHHHAVSNFLKSMALEPGLHASDVIVSVTTLSFDIAVLELFLPLTVGAKTVIATKEQTLDGQSLASLLKKSNATLMQATPATWRLLLTAGWTGGKNFTVLCGGEAFPIDLAQQLCRSVGRVFNMYGPTETTVWSTVYQLNGNEQIVPIGKPIANTTLYVLDSQMHPVPIGVSGELFIGGSGVTLGYLNRPELTAERFLPDPFKEGQKMYRTGDAVRWRRDGVVRFERRVDTQVKVRGFRIELGEIETALSQHPDIAQVVVNVFEPTAGDARLVAYCVTRGNALPTANDFRQFLGKTLPSYMVPQHFVKLDSIPLTPNRKADRKALPPPATTELDSSSDQARGPSTATEKVVLEAFLKVLNRAKLDVHADFFLEGGHSLLAAQMVAGLTTKLERPVPMRIVFENPTVAKLARWLDETGSVTKNVRIPRRAQQTPAPLTLMQERLWYLEQVNPGTTLMHTPSGHKLLGELDEAAFSKAFNAMLRRQNVLRTGFRTRPDGSVEQFTREHRDIQLFPAEDLTHLAAEQREVVLNQLLREEVARVFDLANGPLYRVRMYKLSPQEHVLFFMTHHIIWDGWCFDLFYEEMHFHYDSYLKGLEPQRPELPITYGDFADWHPNWMRRSEVSDQVAYWVNKLKDAPQSLDLPVDKPRPARQTGNGGAVWATISPAVMEQLTAVGRANGSTLYMTLLAAWAVMIAKASGQPELIVGTPVRGRNLPELEKLMGLFVSALPLRLKVNNVSTFLENLTAIRNEVVEAFGNEDAPFEVIVRALDLKRDESRFPLYQTFFSYQNIADRFNTWGNLERRLVDVFQPSSAQDVAMWFLTNPDGSGWACVNFNSDIFEEETARRLLARYVTLLESVAQHADREVRELVAPTPAERAELSAWNATERPEWVGQTLTRTLGRAREQFSERRAITESNTTWTYAQLWSRADELASELVRRGVRRGDVVGLYYERSVEMLAALLGVLRAGATYLPLDPLFPPERIQFMLEDATAVLVLGDDGLTQLGLPTAKTLNTHTIGAGAPVSLPDVNPEDVAYIIYTSGSTGKPKGVKVPHRAVVNFLASMAERPGLTSDDKLVAVTTLSFDIAVLELLLPLTVGAEIVLAKREQVIDGNELSALLTSSGATCMQATPATWRLLLETYWHGGPGFKALCGGEALPTELAEGLLDRVEELWNMYGPTETTVWSTCARVEFGGGGITIGRPIANTTIHIMDPNMQPVPVGVVGEICIGGEGVTLGYHNRPELTDEKFVTDPFSARPGAKLYRTGDLGRYRNDGELLHLGRTDFQVKVRGYRIELGEIEVALANLPGIKQAVVVAQTDRSGSSNLVAYVSVAPGERLNWTDVRTSLRERLPDYMIPTGHVVLQTFPTTPNGKVDRKALPKYDGRESEAGPDRGETPRTPAQKLVAEVWMNLLGVPHVTLRDNFLDLGGHSLLVMRAAEQLAARTGKRVGPRSFIFETLEQVATHYADVEQLPETATPKVEVGVPPTVQQNAHEPRPTSSQKAALIVGRVLSSFVRRGE